jgi:hypothetical protein
MLLLLDLLLWVRMLLLQEVPLQALMLLLLQEVPLQVPMLLPQKVRLQTLMLLLQEVPLQPLMLLPSKHRWHSHHVAKGINFPISLTYWFQLV